MPGGENLKTWRKVNNNDRMSQKKEDVPLTSDESKPLMGAVNRGKNK